jgi:hypothetical protein
MISDQLRSELETVERRGWEALCDGTAAEFYAGVMAPDGMMVLANGMTMDHDDVVNSLSGAPTWDRFEIGDVRVVPIEPNSAALVYHGTAYRGDAAPVVAVMSSVYRRDADRWTLVLYQQTPVAGG